MKATLKRLQKLEAQINRAYSRCRNVEYFFETKAGYTYARRWEKMMVELRGWSDYPLSESGVDLTKDGWKENCGGLHWGYTIGDICA